jgi:ATPase subunit of ABC transporter with duplicated ATPase domains
MISTSNISLKYGARTLFENVSIRFLPGNCYGMIGANGAGKSTFLKILSGENKEYSGDVSIPAKFRLSTLKQDQFAFDNEQVLQTVIMGDTALSDAIRRRDEIYAKPDFSDEDGIAAGDLEERIESLGGYEAESNAAQLLVGLGIPNEMHKKQMSALTASEKVKVLLAQSLFGNPDILLLDEPTNNLDIHAIHWLEEFLAKFEKTTIVVSHDRHFLNQVCTHMADIDFGKISVFTGNYDFWWESSQLIRSIERDQKRKVEEKAKELKDFIARFSANASKSKQATSRKKALEKLDLGEMKASTRKFPFIDFKPEREAGNNLLNVEGIGKTVDGVKILDNVTFEILKSDKVVFMGNGISISALFNILMGEDAPDDGKFNWGVTTTVAYLPAENAKYFENCDLNLIDWLRQYSKEKDEGYIRGFLGRMLFTGDESTKKVSVLSGGEKVRMMLSKIMLASPNVLILDGPTAHLDLESIQAFNNGLIKFPGTILFTSHDHQFVQTVAKRIFEINDGMLKIFDQTFDEYMHVED